MRRAPCAPAPPPGRAAPPSPAPGRCAPGSATDPCWKPTSDARINGPAAFVSSSAPARPGTTTGCPPRSRTEASLWETSTSRARRSSSYTSAAWNTRGCSLTSLPKKRRSRRLKPRSGPEPLPASLRLGDRRVPVGLHAELGRADLEGVARGGERDRLRLDRGEAALQLGARLRGAHPADVDARDRDACRDPARRAGEGEADDERGDREHGNDEQPSREQETPAPRPGAPNLKRRRSRVDLHRRPILAGPRDPTRAGAPSSRGSDRWRRPAAGSRTFPRQSGTPSRRAATSRRGGRA